MPYQRRSTDVDLAGGFRFDLKTGLLLAALLASWYDQRSQWREQAALQKLRDEHTNQQMAEFTAQTNQRMTEFSGKLEAITAYLSNLKASLAAAGVADVDGKPIRRQ